MRKNHTNGRERVSDRRRNDGRHGKQYREVSGKNFYFAAQDWKNFPETKDGKESERRGQEVKAYQKVLLLVWPKLKKLTENIGQYAQAKAYASFSGKETAEKCVQKILDYMYIRDCFAALQEKMKEVLKKLNKEEMYLLEYKYFRRKKVLERDYNDICCEYCERTYYRRQKRLGEKLNHLFLLNGMDEEWFLRTFSSVPYMTGLLERVKSSGELSVVDKRTRGELHVSDAPYRGMSRKEDGQSCAPTVARKNFGYVFDAKIQHYESARNLSERVPSGKENLLNV